MDGVTWFISLNQWEPPLTAVEVDGTRYSAEEVIAALREQAGLIAARAALKQIVDWHPPGAFSFALMTAREALERSAPAADAYAEIVNAARALVIYAEAQAKMMPPISPVNFVTGGHFRRLAVALDRTLPTEN